MQHAGLSDEALVSQLATLCLDDRRTVARIIEHLVEIEDRGLDKRSACSSMWDFCRTRMNMSEGETSRRLNAARLVRRFPSLLGRIERGEVHLSTLKILGPHLEPTNADALLDAAAGKTKMQVKELVASLCPKPDVPTIITEIPAAAATEAPASLPLASAGAQKIVSRIEPRSADGYLVQTMLSKEGFANLERAKDLMRHRLPSGETSAVLERALAVLVERLEKEQLAKTSRPQTKTRPSKPGHISAAARREVFARDGEQCTYVDAQGRRCASTTLLELDHVTPRAKGGSDEPSNLRVRCRAHNRMAAEDVFGKEYVAERIHCRQHQAHRVIDDRELTQPAPALAPKQQADDAKTARCGSAVPVETIEQAARGLVNMGFAKTDVRRALDAIATRNREGASVQDVLKEAIAALT